MEGIVLGDLGRLHAVQGRLAEARAHYEAALDIHRELGNRRYEAIVLNNFGLMHYNQGRMEKARAHCEAALDIHRELGNRRSEGIVLNNLGTHAPRTRAGMENARSLRGGA